MSDASQTAETVRGNTIGNAFTFRFKVLVMFCGLLLASQVAFFVTYDHRSVESARASAYANLQTTLRVFERLLDDRFELLTESVALMSSDFAFRSAIAMGDHATIYSMMQNHSHRVGADIMMAFDTSGKLIVSYPTVSGKNAAESLQAVFSRADLEAYIGDRRAVVASIMGKPYQAVIVPVRAPLVLSYVVVGFNLNDNFARDLKKLTTTEVSFVAATRKPSGGASLDALVSTNIADSRMNEFTDQLLAHLDDKAFFFVTLNGIEYVTYMVPLPGTDSGNFYAVMQKSWQDIMAPFSRLRQILMGLALIFLCLSCLIGMIFSQQVTRPVMLLVDAARRIEKGNYNSMVRVDRGDEIGIMAASFNRMITGLVERDQMKQLALHDTLTGLPNRRSFNESVEDAIRLQQESGIPSAILLIDLDGFKPVNDTYGHAVGDDVLRTVASRLGLSSLRSRDIAARLGGDEFVVLLHGIKGQQEAIDKAEQIIININDRMMVDDCKVNIGCSIGIAMTSKNIKPSEWLEKADHSVYVAKKSGKNAYSFEEQAAVKLEKFQARRIPG